MPPIFGGIVAALVQSLLLTRAVTVRLFPSFPSLREVAYPLLPADDPAKIRAIRLHRHRFPLHPFHPRIRTPHRSGYFPRKLFFVSFSPWQSLLTNFPFSTEAATSSAYAPSPFILPG